MQVEKASKSRITAENCVQGALSRIRLFRLLNVPDVYGQVHKRERKKVFVSARLLEGDDSVLYAEMDGIG